MRLTVLGCAGSFPGPESACSAYLVEAEGFRLLMDFGSGSLSALQRYAGLHAVDAILLTHLHCDHMLDACRYVVVRRYAPDGPYPPLPVYAPAGAPDRLAAAYGARTTARRRRLHVLRLQPGTFPIGPFTRHRRPGATIRWRRTACGWSTTAGCSAYSGGHRAVRGAGPAGPGRRPVPLRGELPRRRGEPAGPAPDRPGGGRGGDQGGGRPAAADPPGGRLGQRGA